MNIDGRFLKIRKIWIELKSLQKYPFGQVHTKLEADASENERPSGMIRIWSCSLLTLT